MSSVARTISATLLSAARSGYTSGGAAGGWQPAIRCIFTSRDGLTSHDYSFDPTLTNNRLVHLEMTELVNGDDGAVIMLKNHDRSVPDLRGYWVDLGRGLRTSAGNQWAEADGAVCQRLWVTRRENTTGSYRGINDLNAIYKLQGVWGAILDRQLVRIGTAPYYQDENGALHGKTIYGVLEYLIETALTTQTGFTFTLDALGTQDDGLINSLIPFPASGDDLRALNPEAPVTFDTYGGLIMQLLSMTGCHLRAKAGLAFQIIYPQSSDAVSEEYYSTQSGSNDFYYEADIAELMMAGQESQVAGQAVQAGNHIELIGSDTFSGPPSTSVIGHWYDPDHYSGASVTDHPQTYDGTFMPVLYSEHDDSLTTVAACQNRAKALGERLKELLVGGRLIIPVDARVEVLDRVQVNDMRGHQ